ncbi:MAG: hypothetical protein F6K50_42525 [Moorea sp. SIO3I7]|nr:hypothetical protein [Moorena sp. SIO3I7]
MSSLPPSIPPVSSPPTNQWLRMVGMWLAVAVIGAGLGWSYQEWQSYRNLLLRLEEVQKHRSDLEYEKCINKATTIHAGVLKGDASGERPVSLGQPRRGYRRR